MRRAVSHRPGLLVLALVLLACTNVATIAAVVVSASLTDRRACDRTRVTRQSLLALRDYAESATRARRESGEREARSDPAQSRIDLKAAAEFQSEADRVTVKQNRCDGLFP